jgi:hypothetical protein
MSVYSSILNNHFHYINPDFNLQNVQEAKPLEALRAFFGFLPRATAG